MFQCSSASRKFLNWGNYDFAWHYVPFQCSSASRKFLNSSTRVAGPLSRRCFSALQRAENSSIRNLMYMRDALERFSALQRAENSSICSAFARRKTSSVSVLFSEPKIPQCDSVIERASSGFVSVLFSEPKIPQWRQRASSTPTQNRFQCSSASRKFLNYRSRIGGEPYR